MQIFITPVYGSSKCLTVKPNLKYSDLKILISEKFNLPTEYFKIVYNGKYIEHLFDDNKTLQEIGIIENSTLRLKETLLSASI